MKIFSFRFMKFCAIMDIRNIDIEWADRAHTKGLVMTTIIKYNLEEF